MGSQLRDDRANGDGLIWIDPTLYFTSSAEKSELQDLRLAEYAPGQADRPFDTTVQIREDGAVPFLYAGLKYYLESGRCEVRTAGFDWRKDIDESAELLMRTIQSFASEFPRRPLYLIAHSQGSLVARRALQRLGKERARQLVNRLILIGPASYGTFSAVAALAGNHEMIAELAHYGLDWPANTDDVMQSMAALYQLMPWKEGTVDMTEDAIRQMGDPNTWKKCDKARMSKFFKWGESLDTAFFNDRTSIILGDVADTPNGVDFVDGVPVCRGKVQGDGTVPDGCAIIHGVTDVVRAASASHMTLPLNHGVMQAVWRVIEANVTVRAIRPLGVAGAAEMAQRVVPLPPPTDLLRLEGFTKPTVKKGAAARRPPAARAVFQLPPAPSTRRLRVFSYDPLLAIDPTRWGWKPSS